MIDTTVAQFWRLDDEGYVCTPWGSRLARLDDGAIMLYDDETQHEHRLTIGNWLELCGVEIEFLQFILK